MSEGLKDNIRHHHHDLTNQMKRFSANLMSTKERIESLVKEIQSLLSFGHEADQVLQKLKLTEKANALVDPALGSCQWGAKMVVIPKGKKFVNINFI